MTKLEVSCNYFNSTNPYCDNTATDSYCELIAYEKLVGDIKPSLSVVCFRVENNFSFYFFIWHKRIALLNNKSEDDLEWEENKIPENLHLITSEQAV